MSRMRILAATASLLAAALVAAEQPPAPSPADVAGQGPMVAAVWVEKEVDFPYRGLTSHYSCDGIRSKVSAILKAIGVRPGFKVDVRSCINYPGVEAMPWVHIRAALPRPLSPPEVFNEASQPGAQPGDAAPTTDKDAAAPEATAAFPARWKRVQFLGTQLGPVQQGDCELLEEMRDSVFVQLGARIVEDQMSCVPHQVAPGSVRLTLEVLQPVPAR